MARAIDADELLAFLYSESAGTDEQLSDWIEECGLSDAEVIDRAKKLCWTVIEGFINVIKTAPTLTPPNEPMTCDGCVDCKRSSMSMCKFCIRNTELRDYYRRPPEGEEDT